MTDMITLTGVVATPPRILQTQSGLAITSFRLASSQRRYDRSRGEWVDGDTNWYTVTAFRQLADNVSASLEKGDRVVVAGRLRVRSWENGERSGTSVEVDADALGHDLHWGTSTFSRVPRGGGGVNGSGDPGVGPDAQTAPGAEVVQEPGAEPSSDPEQQPGSAESDASAARVEHATTVGVEHASAADGQHATAAGIEHASGAGVEHWHDDAESPF